MNFEKFAKRIGSINNANVNWFHLNYDDPANIVIPPPLEGHPILAEYSGLYVQSTGVYSTMLRLTNETYQFVKNSKIAPRTANGMYARPRPRALLNIFDVSNDTIAVWDVPALIIRKLYDIEKNIEGSIHDYILVVTKKSTGPELKNVDYDIRVIEKAELTPSQKEAFLELYDVEALASPHSKEEVCEILDIEQ